MEASAFRGRKAAAEERAEIKMWRRNVLDVKSLGARGLTRQRRAGCPHGGGHLLGLEDTRQGGKRERSRLELKVCSECGAPRALGRHCRLVKWQRGFCVWQMRGRRAVVIACAGDWHAQLGKGLKEAKGPLVTWKSLSCALLGCVSGLPVDPGRVLGMYDHINNAGQLKL